MRTTLLLLFLALACASITVAQSSHSTHSSDKGTGPAFSDPNRITFTPFSFVIAYTQFNPAIGLSYEYLFNRETGMSVYVPVAFGFFPIADDYLFGNGSTVHTSVHAAPGLRFHTGGRNSTKDFATGLGVLVGNMHFKPVADYGTSITPAPYDWGMAGLVSDNSFNVYRNHFMFGFDVRVGTTFEKRDNTQFFLNVGMHFGGKF